jgi:hypothetical protein
MFCPNCGTENAAATGFCSNCGQSIGPIAAAAAPSLPAKPAGKPLTVGLMPLWLILTFNIYWVFWLYKTYKEIRAHTPGATEITPGKAVGFLFIPLFNLYWFFRIMTDMPRAIRRMQEDDSLGEPPLNTGLVTGLLIAGILGNTVLSRIHPALMLVTEPLVIAGFLIAQSSLNAHWERHAAGVAPGQRVAQPAATGVLPQELGTLLGVRTPEIEWGAGAAFLIASIFADLVYLLLLPLFRHGGMPPLYSWVLSLSGDLLLTAAVVACFRWVRSDAGAAALAALGYSILQSVSSVVILSVFMSGAATSFGPARQSVLYIGSLALANFISLLLLALAVRWIRPTWAALWAGASGGQIVASIVYRVRSLLDARLGSAGTFHIDPWDVATDLLFAAVFAFAFWGALALMAPRVLRDS